MNDDAVPKVRDAMLHNPTVHPADVTVGEARAAFDASDKMRMLLIATRGVLISTLTRSDLDPGDADWALAVEFGAVRGRTVDPDEALAQTLEGMKSGSIRRLAVVDDTRRIHGLLCLKSSLDGFCTDAAVDAMRSVRARGTRGAESSCQVGHGVAPRTEPGR